MRPLAALLAAFPIRFLRRYPAQSREWRIVSAVHGRGTLLMGPWLRRRRVAGAWVIAPPGVRLETPQGEPGDPPLTVFGWRQALWMPDASGKVAIDRQRPDHLDACQLTEVINLVASECPQQLEWVANQLTSCVRTLHLLTREDAAGKRAPASRLAHRTLRTFVEDGEEALADRDEQLKNIEDSRNRLPRVGMLRDLCAHLDEQAVSVTDP
jgi:hypothetical protein